MAQENEPTVSGLQEQLKAFQADYREQLSFRYGLDPVSVSAIPLGSVKEMEDQARLMHKAAQPGAKSEAHTPANVVLFPRTIQATVASLMAQKYKGPAKRTEA